MRVLGIETSTSQAAVALVEGGRLVLGRAHARPKQSAERLLPMIGELLAEAGWQRRDLDRIGVSVGPGSFTGLRVGIACAQGLALGLDVPLVGVTSLRAMARAVPDAITGTRVPILDARRGEVFAGGYRAGAGTIEVCSPRALPRATCQSSLEASLPAPLIWLGSGLALLGIEASHASPETQEPSALAVGQLAEELDPEACPPMPVYVRDAGATLPRSE